MSKGGAVRPRPLSVLHLASFVGNIGDNAMHDGEYRTRAEDLPRELRHVPLEVRRFIHWRERSFDDAFVAEANASDALVIGGFSLFQLWRESTTSGTYLDVTPALFERIRVPVLFHGLGCDATRGVNPTAVARTRAFLDAMFALDHCRFSLRNDGSAALLDAHLGPAYAERMDVIADGGLFADPPEVMHPGLEDGRRFIAVNLAGDMPDMRFSGPGGEDVSREFAHSIAQGLNGILERDPDLHCIFVPHIHSDHGPIGAVLESLSDPLRRQRVGVAGLVQGDAGWAAAFDLYRRAEAVVAMRYHANLASMGFGTPVLGISTHHKIEGQYEAYGLADRCLSWTHGTDMGRLFTQLAADLDDPSPARARLGEIRDKERAGLRAYHDRIAPFIGAGRELS